MFENKHSVSMKSRRRFLHLSSFSDSNSFMAAGHGRKINHTPRDANTDPVVCAIHSAIAFSS